MCYIYGILSYTYIYLIRSNCTKITNVVDHLINIKWKWVQGYYWDHNRNFMLYPPMVFLKISLISQRFSDPLKVRNVICNLYTLSWQLSTATEWFICFISTGYKALSYFNFEILTLGDLSHWWSNYPGFILKCTHATIFTCNSQKRDQRNRIFFRVKCSNARIKAY